MRYEFLYDVHGGVSGFTVTGDGLPSMDDNDVMDLFAFFIDRLNRKTEFNGKIRGGSAYIYENGDDKKPRVLTLCCNAEGKMSVVPWARS